MERGSIIVTCLSHDSRCRSYCLEKMDISTDAAPLAPATDEAKELVVDKMEGHQVVQSIAIEYIS